MRKKISSALLIFLTAIFVWSFFFPKNVQSKDEIVFYIARGQSSNQIAQRLKAEGLVHSEGLFKLSVFLSGLTKELKAGEYALSPSMSIATILGKLKRGETQDRVITVIEGWSLNDIAQYLEKEDLYSSKEFLNAAKSKQSTQFEVLKDKPKYASLEGYLFPDTYKLHKGEDVLDVISKMTGTFDKRFSLELKEEVKKQNKSIFEVVTLASLIEKEVQGYNDKRMVSGVLQKRLKVGMALQVDATIAYITGKNTTKISNEETQIASSYNTYIYPGLPIGPIGNPGIDSIKAALYPKENPYWYYLSTPNGTTIYSETLEEHNIAKAKYLN